MRNAAVCLLLLWVALPAAENSKMVGPRYQNGSELVRPEGYRDWKFVGANSGMGYNENVPQKPTFHNMFIQPEAFREFARTGVFPEKTMVVMEVLSIGSSESINKHGQFQDKLIGVEVALKDSSKFAEKWAYFNFIGPRGKQLTQSKAFPKDACWKCHNEHGAFDNVFVQFYPMLREVAPPRASAR